VLKSNSLLAAVIVLVMPGVVVAAPLYDTFGPLDDATFGGTGIPNDEVAISSQFSNGESLITIAMSATQRYDNPALTNDGAGTYFAGAGSNTPSGTTFEGALWNFNYYINIDSPGETLADYESEMYSYIESNDPSIFSDLKETMEFTDEIKDKVNKALTSFGETFKATKGLN